MIIFFILTQKASLTIENIESRLLLRYSEVVREKKEEKNQEGKNS